jgi:hypothetical protein
MASVLAVGECPKPVVNINWFLSLNNKVVD